MNRLAKRLKHVLFMTAIAVCGCVSNSRLRVQSNPDGADIYLTAQNRTPQKVGKTPMELDPSQHQDLFKESVQIQVVKEGFSPQGVLVPRLALGGGGHVQFNLAETALPKVCQVQEQSYNDIARGVAEASALIQRRRLPEALSLVQNLTVKYDTISSLYDLQGNIYYLQKDLNRALEAYQRSNNLTPNVPATLRMIDRLHELQGQGGRQ